MYLPSWVVATLALFRVANHPDDYPPAGHAVGLTAPSTNRRLFYTYERGGFMKSVLSHSKAEEGSIVKLAEDRGADNVWEVITHTSSRQLIKVPDQDLCVSSQTMKTDGDEWEEPAEGDITLVKCPKDDGVSQRAGVFWELESWIGRLTDIHLDHISWLTIVYDTDKYTVTGKIGNETWLSNTTFRVTSDLSLAV